MKTIIEIQAAIRQWMEKEFPLEASTAYEQWIQEARGIAVPGVTTESTMRETGEA